MKRALAECLGTLLSTREIALAFQELAAKGGGRQSTLMITLRWDQWQGDLRSGWQALFSQDGFHKKVTFELILKDGNELVEHIMVWEQEGLPST